MIPAPFRYARAESVEHAVELLGSDDDAKLLAGGHSLLPAMKLRLARPSLLVDIGRLSDLSYVRDGGDRIAIGALTRHHDVEHDPLLAEQCPIVSTTAGGIGDPQVRHRGTIGGSAAHGDPASDMPTVLVALGAELVVRGPEGERVIPAREFFTGVFTTALGPRDVLVEIRVPKLEGAGSAYVKFNRRAQDWALVGCAAIVRDGQETVAWTSVGPIPVFAEDDWLEAAGRLEPTDEVGGSAEYKRYLAGVLAERAVAKARPG